MRGWGLPDEDYMSCEDGLVENHHYRDLRWMDWSDYETVCDDARELLELQERGLEEEEFYSQAMDNMACSLDLDPEVAPAVAALAAAGAVPFTSCSGEEGHYEHHPLVAFWALLEMRPVLLEAAKRSGCELHPTPFNSLMVWHDRHEALVDFGKQLRILVQRTEGGEE